MYCWLLLQIYPCYFMTGFVVQGHIYCFGAQETFFIIIINFENSCAA